MSGQRRQYTPQFLDDCVRLYRRLGRKQRVAKQMRVSIQTVIKALKMAGVENLKHNHRGFPKGNTPWNKGLRGWTKPNSGQFKKGGMPPTYWPVGTIRKRHSKGEAPYLWIKIADPKTWIPYARYVWLQHYGFLIEGDIVRFIDGDTLNCDIENLIAMPREDHIRLNARNGRSRLTQSRIEFHRNRYLRLKRCA